MVYVQENKKGGKFSTIPDLIVKKMGIVKGTQLAFIADSETEGRFKVIR